jgi:hypothetical protein
LPDRLTRQAHFDHLKAIGVFVSPDYLHGLATGGRRIKWDHNWFTEGFNPVDLHDDKALLDELA